MSTVRLLTFFIFAYTCFEGLVVNIMYPNVIAFVFKDFAIALAYLMLMTSPHGPSGSMKRVAGPLIMFGVVTCLYLLLPSPVALIGQLVAIKQRLFYIPMAWVGYHFLRNQDDLLDLVRVMAWMAIPASIFGIYLYFTGPIGLTHVGANYSAVIASTMGEHGVTFWRVPGTFTSPGQFGMFLMTNGVLFLGVLFGKTTKKPQLILTAVALVLVIGALLVSGSRSPLLLMVLCAVVVLMLTGRMKGVALWAGLLYGVLTLGFLYFGDGVKDRVGSIASFEHVERFRDTYFGQMFVPMLLQSPMGLGLGRATIGARHFTEWHNVMLVESYFAIIVAETGVIGLAACMFAMASVLAALKHCHNVMRRASDNVLWYCSVVLVVSIVAVLPVGTAIDAAPANVYLWTFLGIALKAYDLEIAARAAQSDGFASATASAAMPPGRW